MPAFNDESGAAFVVVKFTAEFVDEDDWEKPTNNLYHKKIKQHCSNNAYKTLYMPRI